NHVRQAAHPIVFVGVVVGKNVIFIVEGDVEDIARAGGVDFEAGASGAQAKHTAAMHVEALTVAPDRAEYTFIAGGDVKIAVHGQLEIGGNVVIPIERPGIGVHGRDQIDSFGPDPVRIAE